MGQESLEKINIVNYLLQWEQGLLEENDKQYLKDHFMLGDGGDNSKIEFYQLYIKTFSMKNCELSEWVWKKINGTLGNPKRCDIEKIKPFRECCPKNVTNIYNNYNWKSTEW